MSRLVSMKLQPDWTTQVYQVPAGKRAVITAAISNNNANAKISMAVQQAALPSNYSAVKKISTAVTKNIFPNNLGGVTGSNVILFKNSANGLAKGPTTDRLTTLGPYTWPDVGYWNWAKNSGYLYGVSRQGTYMTTLNGYRIGSNDYSIVDNGKTWDGSIIQRTLNASNYTPVAGCGALDRAMLMASDGNYEAWDNSINGSWNSNSSSGNGNTGNNYTNWDGNAMNPYYNIGGSSRRVCPNSLRWDYEYYYWVVLHFPNTTTGRARIGINRTETLYSPNWFFSGDLSPVDHEMPQWMRVFSVGWVFFTADKKAFRISRASTASSSSTNQITGDHSLIDPAYPWIEYNGNFYAVGTDGRIYTSPASGTAVTWASAASNVAGAPAGAFWSVSNGGSYPALDITYQLSDGLYTTQENEVNIDPAAWLEYQITMRNMRVPLLLSAGDRLLVKSSGGDTAIHIMGYEENV